MKQLLKWWWRRVWHGEKRVQGATRGRVIQQKFGLRSIFENMIPTGGGHMRAVDRPVGTISARVFRAETGEWEDHGVIAEIKEKD